MNTNLPIAFLCGLLSLAGSSDQAVAEPADGHDQNQSPQQAISVNVASGRTFVGQLDSRTDREQLWLRSGRDAAVVRRPIRWDRVIAVRLADQDYSGEELQQIVRALKPKSPEAKEKRAAPKQTVVRRPTRSGGFLSVTCDEPPKHRRAPRVRSLAVDAVAANWDADVEVDGLLVYVFPLDHTGAVVSVRGTLQCDLTGSRQGVIRRPQPFATLGRWARQVRVEDFGPRGAVYRLPFQGVHPEFDLSVQPHGALHARLGVPGQGTFETTQSMVRVRPYSSVRDELQLSTGRRFFPQERTGRSSR